MGSVGFREIFIILLIVLLLFGAKKIPELARGLGQGIREFKDGMRDSSHEEKKKEDPKG
ncbi:MAG: twin-arginine translocase TatA/TatE family subunit [Candidatus Eisenbacteria bacterium]|nr:twin-arginine translocase TatA/TatE family subunit [Candidatus Eisenbacteria bacterium]